MIRKPNTVTNIARCILSRDIQQNTVSGRKTSAVNHITCTFNTGTICHVTLSARLYFFSYIFTDELDVY